MIKNVTLHDRPAYKVNAVCMAETPKAGKYNIEGDRFWIPKSVSKFQDNESRTQTGARGGTLLILDWYYKKHIEGRVDENENYFDNI